LIYVVETEGAVFAVNRVGGFRWGDVGGLDVRAGGHDGGGVPEGGCRCAGR
jgi:hypothetical protein